MINDTAVWNTVWNVPDNPMFEKPQDVINYLKDYSIIGKIVESDMKNHVGIAVPNHSVERAAYAIIYKFGRNV